MLVDRRTFSASVGALLGSSCMMKPSAPIPDPLLRLARRGNSKVYLFGFADAADESWFTPKIERAVDEATELWVETPPMDLSAPQSGAFPAVNELGYDRGRDLFQVLPPDLSKRVEDYATRLELPRERLSPMKPWLAREAIQRAWVTKNGGAAGALTPKPLPDQAIIARMKTKSIPIRSEFASIDDVLRSFATMSEQGQVEYLRNLLDYFDGEQSSANDDVSGWIYGRPSERLILEQKQKTPALYAAMHFERNKWWAESIDRMLDEGGTRFVLVGLNHVLGPDSIQISAERRGIVWRLV
jgi:uncharacterized protein YbaP (TraB family)